MERYFGEGVDSEKLPDEDVDSEERRSRFDASRNLGAGEKLTLTSTGNSTL